MFLKLNFKFKTQFFFPIPSVLYLNHGTVYFAIQYYIIFSNSIVLATGEMGPQVYAKL